MCTKLKYIVASIVAILAPTLLCAQMTITEIETPKKQKLDFRSTIKQSSLSTEEYFSLARYKAERDSIRQERNTLEIISSLQGSFLNYNDPWVNTSGGDNTTTILGSFKLNHAYKRNKFTLTSKVAASFGYNSIKIDVDTDEDGNAISEGVWYKNKDEFSISIAPTISISSVWSYGSTVTFRTQFANGYYSRSQQESIHLLSGFMSPGYLDVSGGMTYKSPVKTLPFTINIAPLALSATYVSSEAVRQNYLYQFLDHEDANWDYVEPYGISPYASSNYEGGSSLQVDYDRTFEKWGNIRYTSMLYTFYGWMTQSSYDYIIDDYDEYLEAVAKWSETEEGIVPILSIRPTVRWENTISIPATDVLSTTITFKLYYNRAQDVKIQTQTLLSVGLSYTFKNK